jgi:hypothetical protein
MVVYIYVVYDSARRLCYVGQSMNPELRAWIHWNNFVRGDQLAEWAVVEVFDNQDQLTIDYSELDWMNRMGADGWRVLNIKRQRVFGGSSGSAASGHRGGSKNGRHKILKISDPERYHAAQSAAGRKGGRAGGAEGGRVTCAKRRKCQDCDMISSPGALGKHLSYAGHSGWIEVMT